MFKVARLTSLGHIANMVPNTEYESNSSVDTVW